MKIPSKKPYFDANMRLKKKEKKKRGPCEEYTTALNRTLLHLKILERDEGLQISQITIDDNILCQIERIYPKTPTCGKL